MASSAFDMARDDIPLELRRLQHVLSDMLVELDRVCKKNGIRYCLIAGTLLGAVRHKGFIPWDDDLDVAMTRDEYEKFRAACKTDLNTDKFFFQDNTTDPYYRWGYGRIRRKNSEFIRKGQEHMKMQTGIFLDIFPLDSVPDFAPVRYLHNIYCTVLRKMLYAEVGKVTGKNVVIRKWYSLLDKIPVNAVHAGQKSLFTYWNKKDTKLVRNYSFPTPPGRKKGYLREWYTDLTNLEFEGKMFPAPKNWHGYLVFKFNDYMELPPPDKRRFHPASRIVLPPGYNG